MYNPNPFIPGVSITFIFFLRSYISEKVVVCCPDFFDSEIGSVLIDKLSSREFKSVDLIIQSSGVAYINSKLDWKKEEDTIKTNVLGVTKLYDLSFNLFRKQGFGHLVGISSIASIRGSRSAPAYFSSKAYQKAYLESLYINAKTINSNKVLITDIRPGFVDTAMALGEGIFWLVPLDKAAKQIYSAIQKKKRVAYISKRWALIAFVLKIVPSWLLRKIM